MMDYNSLNHAKHNESVCEHLFDKTKYSDWIITTSFYSAMHYVRHALFPYKIVKDGKEIICNSFDEYCLAINQPGKKHNALRKLVEENCPIDIASAYNQMLDSSWTARYSQYKFSEKIANLAKKRLVVVKNHSLRVRPESTTSS